jgi:3-hydroxyisobutyrate dehydrogenase-like beta-hydroxyacid dehydrogenase
VLVGLVGSGAMGSALGARLREGGARVLVALDGRSARTRRRAHDAGLEDVGTLDALVRGVDVVLSVVPPGSALEVAGDVSAAAGDARPLFADLNAIAPATARAVAVVLAEAGIETIDGSISGPPPPGASGVTRVYLSGSRAGEIAALPVEGAEWIVVGDGVGMASAVKMCTASVYKGRVALLAQALRTADAHGVVEHVLTDLVGTGLADPARVGGTLGKASAKAWRYVPEMEEIAATQAAAGLTPELFLAVARVYEGLAEQALAEAPEDVPGDLPLAVVLARLSAGGAGRDVAEKPSRTG